MDKGEIDTTQWLSAGSARLYVEVHGRSDLAPTLLWLHGGPGGAERPMFRLFNRDLERSYRVAYLDQRGAGRSYHKGEPRSVLTVAQHLSDLDLIVSHLEGGQSARKIILVGHSWGGQLALLYAARHPSKVAAVIAVNPLIALRKKQQSQFEVLSKAASAGDRQSRQLLLELGAPPYGAEAQEKVDGAIGELGGLWHSKPNLLWAMLKVTGLGLITLPEIGRFIEANRVSLAAMHDELLKLDIASSIESIEVPVALFFGIYDRQVSPAAAIQFMEKVDAPGKYIVAFDRSAHNLPFEEPEALSACLAAIRAMIEEKWEAHSDSCPYEVRSPQDNQSMLSGRPEA